MSSDVLDLLDSQLTSAEFMEGMAQGKTVRETRASKGFPHMRRLGMLGLSPKTRMTNSPHPTEAGRKEKAIEGARLINEQHMTTAGAARTIGVSDTTLRSYLREFGLKVLARRVRKGSATEAVCKEVIQLVNKDGHRISHAAEMAGSNCVTVRLGLSRLGMKYNASKIKIERIRK